jgi:hypothetical protein
MKPGEVHFAYGGGAVRGLGFYDVPVAIPLAAGARVVGLVASGHVLLVPVEEGLQLVDEVNPHLLIVGG